MDCGKDGKKYQEDVQNTLTVCILKGHSTYFTHQVQFTCCGCASQPAKTVVIISSVALEGDLQSLKNKTLM